MKCGMVAIVGRPNVGKSSLLNALVGQKVSIVSHKPQTTRHRIQGVLHGEGAQVVFVDTPGIHRHAPRALNKAMNEAALGALHDVDLILFVVEAGRFTDEDQLVLERLATVQAPVALIVNKVDRYPQKDDLLPELAKHGERRDFAFITPLSAEKRSNIALLSRELLSRMPEGEPLYPEEMVVGHGPSFTASEVIREKIVRNLHQELPYATTVEVDQMADEDGLLKISAIIWVEREGQKKIVIGKDGSALKHIGTKARMDLERQLGCKVFLRLWCKVRENWSDDPKALERFGLGPG